MGQVIVTGAAGFVGSNLVRALNARGYEDVIAVDDLTQGDKFRNLAGCRIADYLDVAEFRDRVRRGWALWAPEAVFHQGACADTTESDGRYMMDANYACSREVLHWCLERRVPLVYASSASVYGLSRRCVEDRACERPLNVYAYSKWQFDEYVRRLGPEIRSTVVGLRYFNVYGPGEAHKGRMASMVWQLWRQVAEGGVARLFEGTDGYGPGEQRRDFVAVSDVAAVNLHFGLGGRHVGIYNVGSGRSRSFNDVSRAVIARLGRGRVEYVPFPESLRGKYQSFTEADVTNLRERGGYVRPMLGLEAGIDAMISAEAGADGGAGASATAA
jgi:ADP-L-glycero-D-manno-heptose 6-epimerase